MHLDIMDLGCAFHNQSYFFLETIVKPGASFICFCKYKLYRLTHMKISTTIHVTQC